MSTPGQLFLVICAFLCLIPGDALQCSVCVAMEEGGKCEMSTCEIDGEGQCIALIVYKAEEVFEKILGCSKKADVTCDATSDDPENGMHYKLKCCDESDLCNSKF
ncbi:---NA--- [Podarcis lilfordi]|uniref:---NA n=1 Tax=Podarcis lilfordi TaxID=74358 RepID=A0AA35K3H1_9SAUR|nr:---NA--- [Podarcis lilfordi]